MELLPTSTLSLEHSVRDLPDVVELSTFYSDLQYLMDHVDIESAIIVVLRPPTMAHYSLLSKLYPEHIFHIWSPGTIVDAEENIKLYSRVPLPSDFEKKYTMSEKYVGKTYLISHIDSGSNKDKSESEEYNFSDLSEQNLFCRAAPFLGCSIRFRLPKPSEDYDKVSYLSGCLYSVPYQKGFVLNTRLVPKKEDDKWTIFDYDPRNYAERVNFYKNGSQNGNQLKDLLERYSDQFNGIENINDKLTSMCLEEINKNTVKTVTLSGYAMEEKKLFSEIVQKTELPSTLERSRAYMSVISDLGDVNDL